MKLRKVNLYVVGIMMLAMLGGISPTYAKSAKDKTTAEDVKQEAQEFLQSLKSYSIDQKDEAIKQTKIALDKLDNRIDSLETRIDNQWDNMTQPAREKARSTLKSLRKQRTELAEWYGGLKSDSGNAWDDIKQGFSDAYSRLHEAWEKAEKEFESESEK
ncbi:MAG: hypothetical protein KUG72_11395 [Pseudomonadales bacterium]|nr:hypothetical protein [Pseudomonadales bacterium]